MGEQSTLQRFGGGILVFVYIIIVICILFVSGALFGFEKYYTSELAALDAILTDEIYPLDTHRVQPKYDGKTVYAYGTIDTENTIVDPYFGITADTFALICNVEYFQWVEDYGRKRKLIPDYDREWRTAPVPTDDFDDEKNNTLVGNYADYRLYAKDIFLDAHTIDASIVDNTPSGPYSYEFEFTQEMLDTAQAHILEQASQNQVQSDSIHDYYYFLQEGTTYPLVHKVGKNEIYVGLDPETPRIGDIRLEFTIIPKKQEVSFVAKQQGNTLHLFADAYGETATLMVQPGKKDVDYLIDNLQKEAFQTLWFIRVSCPIVLFFFIWMLTPAMKRTFHKSAWLRGSSFAVALKNTIIYSLLVILVAHLFILVPRVLHTNDVLQTILQ